LLFLCERLHQGGILLSFLSQRGQISYYNSLQKDMKASYLAVSKLIAAVPANAGEAELAAVMSQIQNWEDAVKRNQFRSTRTDGNVMLPLLSSPAPAIEALALASSFRISRRNSNRKAWKLDAFASTERLKQQILLHPQLLPLRIQMLAIMHELGNDYEALRPMIDETLKLAPDDQQVHSLWANCLRPDAGGSAALLKERIEILSRNENAFTAAGLPLCLLYLDQLTACEGNEVLQESWVSDSLNRCLEHLEGHPATPNLALRRSQIIGRLLPAADKSLMPRLLRRYDLLKDLDLMALRPEINGPLDLARLCVSEPQLSLVETVEKALDWQAGKPFESAIPAGQLLDWAKAVK
jgi:hypothetical protein